MIEVKGLTKRFKGQTVLNGIDLTVQPGEVVAIIGPSGSGKTTFLRCLNLLETPSSGRIRVADIEIDGEHHLWGRGTVDMKGGTAVQLKLAAELVSPRVDITWMWYDNEEVEASRNGLGRLARQHPELLAGDFAVLMEPTGAVIEGGCQGTLRFEIATRGLAAHSARS